MRMSPEIAILILFRRCLRPQARFGAQPPLAAALSAEMRRNSARLISLFQSFFDTLCIIAASGYDTYLKLQVLFLAPDGADEKDNTMRGSQRPLGLGRG